MLAKFSVHKLKFLMWMWTQNFSLHYFSGKKKACSQLIPSISQDSWHQYNGEPFHPINSWHLQIFVRKSLFIKSVRLNWTQIFWDVHKKNCYWWTSLENIVMVLIGIDWLICCLFWFRVKHLHRWNFKYSFCCNPTCKPCTQP